MAKGKGLVTGTAVRLILAEALIKGELTGEQKDFLIEMLDYRKYDCREINGYGYPAHDIDVITEKIKEATTREDIANLGEFYRMR